jgi:uncharacterized membrane protein
MGIFLVILVSLIIPVSSFLSWYSEKKVKDQERDFYRKYGKGIK